MNDGIFSMFIFSVVLVLYATGWKRALFGAISNRTIVAGLALWFVGWWIALPVGAHAVSGSLALLLAVSLIGLAGSENIYQAAHLLSLAMLAASVHVFVMQLQHLDPLLLPLEPSRVSAGLIGVLAACSVNGLLRRTAMITFGLLLGDGLHRWIADAPQPALIGDAAFFDMWWLVMAVGQIAFMLIDGWRRLWNMRSARRVNE